MEDNKNVKQIRVSNTTAVKPLATSILFSINEGKEIELRAVGASAVNQMYKGITIARGECAAKGKDLYIKPGFEEIETNGEKRTVMLAKLIIQ